MGELRLWFRVRISNVIGTNLKTRACLAVVVKLWNFSNVLIGTCDNFLESRDKMNKRAIAIGESTFKLIISTMKKGFEYNGVSYKPNDRIATVLTLEYNLGLRVGDILQLKLEFFLRDGNRYRLDMYEQKTGKYRNFTVPNEVYQFILDYAYRNSISSKAKLFPITERAVSKHLKAVCSYLGMEGVTSHSFRKGFATNIYVNNHYNIELVRTLLQHSSVTVTQRYIGIGSRELEDAIQKNICLR